MTERLLANLKVLELGDFFSAPYCSKLLADLGAEVIKVEMPGTGDSARRRGPFYRDVPHPEGSGLFLVLNMNKMGITLDVSIATGREIFLELVRRADVVVENFGPQVMSDLGLDFEQLSSVNPGIVLTSISSFGQTGPYRDYKAPDLVAFHMGGYASKLGGPVKDVNTTAPLKAAEHQADYASAVNAAAGTIAGLLTKAQSGAGQHVDISKQESTIPFVFSEIADVSYDGAEPNRRLEDNPPTGVVSVLPTIDGYVGISPREDHLWARWIEVMGNPDWAEDERFSSREARIANWSELEPLLIEWTSERRKTDIFRAAQAERVPSFPVNTIEDIYGSAQLEHRDYFTEVDHPLAGRLRFPTMPYRFSSATWALRRPAPTLGEHNVEIYRHMLGLTPDYLVSLRRAQVI